ncbi:MAG: inorganic phosphate transporter, partial [Desulfobulbaceae bacterium]|nr:inorganic phosphate transporter [Desulfobulbaceae bacterium]
LFFAFILSYFKVAGIPASLLLVGFGLWKSHHYHSKQESQESLIRNLNLKDGIEPAFAVNTSFEQVGYFLNEVSVILRDCLDAVWREDRARLREVRSENKRIQQIANIIIANIFKTLYLLDRHDVESTRKYKRTIGALQEITESLRDIVMRSDSHVSNYHTGFNASQREELNRIRISTSRLLENTSIMLRKNKKVDYEYIKSQRGRLEEFLFEFNKNQIKRIQNKETKTRLNILYYGFLRNCEKISDQTQNLLDIFREYFQTGEEDGEGRGE